MCLWTATRAALSTWWVAGPGCMHAGRGSAMMGWEGKGGRARPAGPQSAGLRRSIGCFSSLLNRPACSMAEPSIVHLTRAPCRNLRMLLRQPTRSARYTGAGLRRGRLRRTSRCAEVVGGSRLHCLSFLALVEFWVRHSILPLRRLACGSSTPCPCSSPRSTTSTLGSEDVLLHTSRRAV
jgi:hypothetical protein